MTSTLSKIRDQPLRVVNVVYISATFHSVIFGQIVEIDTVLLDYYRGFLNETEIES